MLPALLGVAFGLATLAFIRLVLEPVIPEAGARLAAAGQRSILQRLGIVYTAAFGEELLFRLLLMSAIAGVIARAHGGAGRVPGRIAIAASNIAASLAFGLAHLPAWSRAT